MNKSDFGKFNEEISRTADAFNAEMTPGRIKTYFEDLEDLSLEAVIGALQCTRKTATFFPKIAELRKFAEGSVDDKAELAWRTLVDLVKFEGEYPSLQVYDGGIAYAIDCWGGWVATCAKLNAASPEMTASYAKEFKNSYKLGLMRSEQSKYFVGAVEVNNRALGHWKSATVEQPVMLVRPGKSVKVLMPLDIQAGRLTAEARQALEKGGDSLKKYLPGTYQAPKVLAAAPGAEMATPEDVAELKRQIGTQGARLRLVPRKESR